jgi:hypothetical protein
MPCYVHAAVFDAMLENARGFWQGLLDPYVLPSL